VSAFPEDLLRGKRAKLQVILATKRIEDSSQLCCGVLQFTGKIDVIDLSNANNDLIEKTIEIRKRYRFKLPDAVIIATALLCKAHLVTGDKALAKVKETDVILL
jgi:predicted nucleic acid-binding protein